MYIVIYFQNKNKLYQIWRKKRTTQHWNTYIEYKRKYNLIEAKIKYNYYEKKFIGCKADTKKVWSVINNILGRKKRNSVLTFTAEDAAHNFNAYFTSIATNLLIENYGSENHLTSRSFTRYLSNCETKLANAEFDICDLKKIFLHLIIINLHIIHL